MDVFPEHYALLSQVESAHTSNPLPFWRACRLRVVDHMPIPVDLQRMVIDYMSDALVWYLHDDDLLANGMITAADRAEDEARAKGRKVSTVFDIQ
jgi:hypothetical protein